MDNAKRPLSACKFSLYLRPSSKHIVREGLRILLRRSLRDLTRVSGFNFAKAGGIRV